MATHDWFRGSRGDAGENERDECRSASPTEMFEVLKDRYRRRAFSYLVERPTADLERLLDYVVTHETGHLERSDRREKRRQLEIEFYHRHLPMLEDLGFVEYDERNGTLAYRAQSPLFEQLLRLSLADDR